MRHSPSLAFSFFSVEETFPVEKKSYYQDSTVGTRTEPLARRKKKMKKFNVGILAAAFLLVVAGVGFGAEQMGTHPMGSMEESMQGETPQSATSPADDLQLRNPTETGSLPAESRVDSSKVENEGYVEREWKGDIDGH
jgi:hypothetical protein